MILVAMQDVAEFLLDVGVGISYVGFGKLVAGYHVVDRSRVLESGPVEQTAFIKTSVDSSCLRFRPLPIIVENPLEQRIVLDFKSYDGALVASEKEFGFMFGEKE